MNSFVALTTSLACALVYVSAPASAHYVAYGHTAAPYSGAHSHIPAHIKVLSNGYLEDTPEVAHARGAHHAAQSHVAAAAEAHPDLTSPHHEPAAQSYALFHATPSHSGASIYAQHAPAHITVLSNGHLADTPEVAHAKQVHFAETAKAAAAAAAQPDYASHAYSNGGHSESGSYNNHDNDY